MDRLTLSFSFLLTLHLSISGIISTATFTFLNKCDYTVWPAILSNAGFASLSTTGFVLLTGDSKTITAPTYWGGRVWARTFCTQNSTTGIFSCVTGDCSSGNIECSGNGATPPATLAEFKLDGYGGLDYFDVSVVDGYNLPMLVVPNGGSGVNCTATGCVDDLNGACPSELRVMSVDGKRSVACKSACEAFGTAEYCCKGAYASPDTCKASSYSEMFKKACPSAYSYAYDDKTSTFTCTSVSTDYTITFCASPNTSKKTWQGQNLTDSEGSDSYFGSLPQINDNNNNTMVYVGGADQSEISSSWSKCTHFKESHAIVSIVIAIWLLRHPFF
ncbi:unnamed protein product [Lupinus luteus]|uniref:Uncharacterized protein n=1 Tax=Lupinus luteus TaxID=3873 RepID=A0AAV1XZ29_LUPLU